MKLSRRLCRAAAFDDSAALRRFQFYGGRRRDRNLKGGNQKRKNRRRGTQPYWILSEESVTGPGAAPTVGAMPEDEAPAAALAALPFSGETGRGGTFVLSTM